MDDLGVPLFSETSRWWYQMLFIFTPILGEMIQLTFAYFKFRAGKNPRKCILLEWTFCMTTYFGPCKVSSSQTSWVVVRGVAPKTQFGKGSWPWGNQQNSHPFNPWNFSPWTYPNSLNALKWWVAGACLYNSIYIYIERERERRTLKTWIQIPLWLTCPHLLRLECSLQENVTLIWLISKKLTILTSTTHRKGKWMKNKSYNT